MDENEEDVPMDIEREVVVASEGSEMKVPRAKIRVTSADRTPSSSPIKKIMIRQSTDSPTRHTSNYEIITRKDSKVQEAEVRLHRYESLNNGLDPIGIELISSASMASSKAGSEYSDKSDDFHGSPKISREMKNLQNASNESKILSNYLTATNESPRRRKNKEVLRPDPDEEIEEIIETEEVEMKNSPASLLHEGGADSDSALVLPMEPPVNRRRKSVPRSRSHSRSSSHSRKKSIARMMKDELSVTSDKDEGHEDEDEDLMSEVSFVTNRSIDGRAVNPPPKPGWDSFCFKCHTDTAVLSLACSQCKCSYHRHCVRPNPIPKNVDEFVCTECREVEAAESSNYNKYGHDKINPNTLAEMLTIILEKIRTYPDREHFENDIVVKVTKEPSQPFIVTQMSLKTLEGRIKSRHYKVTEAFIHDIKQLEHNWNVVDRSKSKTLKTILKYVNTEINELEACVFCYENSFITGDWFVHPCKRPHLLIWAKLKGYPYWPAKVMSVDSRQQVDVRFFGAHDRAWVPSTHCILFCEKDPNKTKVTTPNKNASKTQKGIADAMKEKDDYIENLKAKFGFRYAPRQQFNTNDLQKQLDLMLPGLKASKEGLNGSEKEFDGAHKEKLTLKIVKGQSSNYQVEHKQTEKDKPKLYKVLSKNDDNANMEQTGISLIIKRKSMVEQEVERSKRSRISDTASETSESNASAQSVRNRNRKNSLLSPKRKPMKKVPTKSAKESAKAAKEPTKAAKEPTKAAKEPPKVAKEPAQEPPAKKTKHSEKQKPKNDEDEESLLAQVANPKTMRKSRAKSSYTDFNTPMVVRAINVPPGTDEITTLRELTPSPPPASRIYKRGSSIPLIKRSLSEAAKSPSRKNSIRVSISRSPAPEQRPIESGFDPDLVIKAEPVSDNEEAMQQDSFTLSDIPNLMQDKSGKKKLIVISTDEGGESSAAQKQKSRARKTFPNHINHNQADALTNQQLQQGRQWMVCIPQAFPTANGASTSGSTSNMQSPPGSNRSTPVSDSQNSLSQMRSNQSSARTTPTASNRSINSNVPLMNFNNNVNEPNTLRRSSTHSNQAMMNGGRLAVRNMNNNQQGFTSSGEPPRLVPRPQGAFISDGSAFNRDVGPVSRMFADNAHRVSDFFRNVILETITSFAPDVPTAENLMLRAEIEKFHREMQSTKADCQMKMQELRREHQDEIDSLKKMNDDKMRSLQLALEQEQNRVVNDVRLQCEAEKQRAIDITRKETKKTTWCSNCTKEARFYCCWNTSYCGPQCQKSHWQTHQKYCTNKNSVNETPTQTLVSKQTNTEATVVVAAQSTSVSKPTIMLGPPHQFQITQTQVVPVQTTSSQGGVVSYKQIILPANTIQSTVVQPGAFKPVPVNDARSILVGTFKNQPIYQRENSSLIVKPISRINESPPSGLSITPLQGSENFMLQNNIAAPTSTSQE